jgi:DNA polymerase-1
MNFPMQGTCADGLKLAMALLYERRHECPGAVPVLALHDELVVECNEGDVEKVEGWLETAMIEGMDRVVNGPEVGGPRVPIEVEIKIGRTWAG